jgi:hypothetical protein
MKGEMNTKFAHMDGKMVFMKGDVVVPILLVCGFNRFLILSVMVRRVIFHGRSTGTYCRYTPSSKPLAPTCNAVLAMKNSKKKTRNQPKPDKSISEIDRPKLRSQVEHCFLPGCNLLDQLT